LFANKGCGKSRIVASPEIVTKIVSVVTAKTLLIILFILVVLVVVRLVTLSVEGLATNDLACRRRAIKNLRLLPRDKINETH
jgi:hypothetical protein